MKLNTKGDGRYLVFARELQKWRKASGISLSELARNANISKSNLSRLESGDGNPSLETLWSLSKALKIGIRELIDPHVGGTRIERAYHQFFADAETADFSVALLSSCPIGSTRDIYRATLEPGEAKISEAHGPGIIEHVILLGGQAHVGPVEKPALLTTGDYVTFSGNQEHLYEALEEGATAIIVMEHA